MRMLALVFVAFIGCGDNTADEVGVGAECSGAMPCPSYVFDAGTMPLQCLAFKGGYCGLQGCANSAGGPRGSICVKHTDGTNYCFRACVDKPECNRRRSSANESNCSSSFNWAVPSEDTGSKACIPPSSI